MAVFGPKRTLAFIQTFYLQVYLRLIMQFLMLGSKLIPLVTGNSNIRYFAGASITLPSGEKNWFSVCNRYLT